MSKPLTQGKVEVDCAPSPVVESESQSQNKKTVGREQTQGKGGYSSSLTEERKRPKRNPGAEKRVKLWKKSGNENQGSVSDVGTVKEHGFKNPQNRRFPVDFQGHMQQATDTQQPNEIHRPEGRAGKPMQFRTRSGHYPDMRQERHHPPKQKGSRQPPPGYEQDRECCRNEQLRPRWRQQQHQRHQQAVQREERVGDDRTATQREAKKHSEPHLKIHSSDGAESRHPSHRSGQHLPSTSQPQCEKESSSDLMGAVRCEGNGALKDPLTSATAKETVTQSNISRPSQSGGGHSRERRPPVVKVRPREGKRTGGRPPKDVCEKKSGSDRPCRQTHDERRPC